MEVKINRFTYILNLIMDWNVSKDDLKCEFLKCVDDDPAQFVHFYSPGTQKANEHVFKSASMFGVSVSALSLPPAEEINNPYVQLSFNFSHYEDPKSKEKVDSDADEISQTPIKVAPVVYANNPMEIPFQVDSNNLMAGTDYVWTDLLTQRNNNRNNNYIWWYLYNDAPEKNAVFKFEAKLILSSEKTLGVDPEMVVGGGGMPDIIG